MGVSYRGQQAALELETLGTSGVLGTSSLVQHTLDLDQNTLDLDQTDTVKFIQSRLVFSTSDRMSVTMKADVVNRQVAGSRSDPHLHKASTAVATGPGAAVPSETT